METSGYHLNSPQADIFEACTKVNQINQRQSNQVGIIAYARQTTCEPPRLLFIHQAVGHGLNTASSLMKTGHESLLTCRRTA